MEELNIFVILIHAAALYGAFKLGQITIINKIAQDLVEKVREGKMTEDELRRALADDEELELPVRSNVNETQIEIERHSGRYYVYTTEGEFLAHGDEFRGLFEDIKQRFPDRKFRLKNYQARLTEEESQRMVKNLFEVFDEKK